MTIDPADTLRPGASGFPVEMAGTTWILSGHAPASGQAWDDIYDAAILTGACDVLTVQVAAESLLSACHNLSLDDSTALIRAADPHVLAAVVRSALFGPERVHRTRSSWVRSALLANGLSPDRIADADLRDVLDQLVATGRAVAPERWISSAEYQAYRARLDRDAGGGP